jgi:hypothetical protein
VCPPWKQNDVVDCRKVLFLDCVLIDEGPLVWKGGLAFERRAEISIEYRLIGRAIVLKLSAVRDN